MARRSVLLLAALGAVLILQGWKSRIPNFDMLTTIDAAQAASSITRTPAGPWCGHELRILYASWADLADAARPGAVRDSRLFEYPGSLALYVGTLLGIFLVARRYFGDRCALVAVVLYGFSELGLTVGSSLLHRHPVQFFFVWVVYWVARWADETTRAGSLPRLINDSVAVPT